MASDVSPQMPFRSPDSVPASGAKSGLKAIFFRLVQIPDALERQRLLEKETQGDIPLRNRVAELLRGHFSPQPKALGQLARQALVELRGLNRATDSSHPDTLVGQVLNAKYELIEKIGEGGMGIVYKARQIAPVSLKRMVAVKIIKPGLNSSSVLERFETERTTLARMDHPHVSRILDAGEAESGQPYFVMDYIEGLPLLEYLEKETPPLEVVVKLLIKVCQGVHHAHQKGIIHGDIKPNNILVSMEEGRPHPHVIDFGIARATDLGRDRQPKGATQEIPLGSLDYMSPEQANLDSREISLETDIYSLGAVFFRILTGSTPLGDKQRKWPTFAQSLQAVRDSQVPSASARFRAQPPQKVTVKEQRLHSSWFASNLIQDLDWILAKAMEKNTADRYPSALELGNDLRRFLKTEAVSARKGNLLYIGRKFVQRNQAWMVLASALCLLSMIALGGVGLAWGRFEEQTAQVEYANNYAQKCSSNAEKALAKAESLSEGLRKTHDILTTLVKTTVSKKESRRGTPQHQDQESALDQASKHLDDLEEIAAENPAQVAKLRTAIGDQYLELGASQKALAQFLASREKLDQVYPREHPSRLAIETKIGLAYKQAGLDSMGFPQLRSALESQAALLSPADEKLWFSLEQVAGYLGHPKVGSQARDILEKVLAYPENFGQVPDPYLSLTWRLTRDKAGKSIDPSNIPLYTNFLQLAETFPGKGLGPILAARICLAKIQIENGQVGLGLKELETVHIHWKNTETTDLTALEAVQEMALLYLDIPTKKALGADLLRDIHRDAALRLGDGHPFTLKSMIKRGTGLRTRNRLESSREMLEEALLLAKSQFGENHEITRDAKQSLALTLELQGDGSGALSLFHELVHGLPSQGEEDTHTTIRPLDLFNLGNCLAKFRQAELAEPYLLAARVHFQNQSDRPWRVAMIDSLLGQCAFDRGDYPRALQLCEQACTWFEENQTQLSPRGRLRHGEALKRWVHCREAIGMPEAYRGEHQPNP